MDTTFSHKQPTMHERLAHYPLLDALLHRRSRRFAKGMQLSGPLAYRSEQRAQPLTLEEEAALAFAACGITGYALGDLPYDREGNIMVEFVGRTVATGDAIHSVALFVINDEGAWLMKRPQEYPRTELPGIVEAARRHELVELYLKGRVQVAHARPQVPQGPPATPPFNAWSANVPGTTYFLPVNDLTALTINVLLSAFSDGFAYFILDDRNRYLPAGIGRFARSRGGHLYDDPQHGRVLTIGAAEISLSEFTALEQGAILQNLGLMAAALGLGGYSHFAVDSPGWFRALGFRMEEIPFSRTIGAGAAMRLLLRALKKDVPMATGLGLERDGEPLLKPYCPPYYRSMEEAVLAFVDHKYAPGTGTLRDGGTVTGWRDGATVQAAIPRYSDQAIAATIAYCEYVYQRYGRFPAFNGPYRTILAYQAHHVDADFYDHFYKPEAQMPGNGSATGDSSISH